MNLLDQARAVEARLREGQQFDYESGHLLDMSFQMGEAADTIASLITELEKLQLLYEDNCLHRYELRDLLNEKIAQLTKAENSDEHNYQRWKLEAAKLETMQGRLEAAQADAARYRYVRDPKKDVSLAIDKRTGFVPPDESVAGVGGYYTYEYRSGEELDQAIDAAIAAQSAQGENT